MKPEVKITIWDFMSGNLIACVDSFEKLRSITETKGQPYIYEVEYKKGGVLK